MSATPEQALIECIPNFSEGRDAAKVKQITDVIESVAGIQLLSTEMGADANRTVVTFVGPPAAVVEAAFQAISKAAKLIDLHQHRGNHPRMGATDVCPFVPVSGITMQECVQLSKKLGARVGEELGIPVYLYEESATRPERQNLATVRQGEFEGLAKKLKDPAWKPDFGPATLPSAGATVIGAREFLIAYNITLNSPDKQLAADIAFELKEKGRIARVGNTKPYYFRGRKLSYTEQQFPCGSCEFVGKTYTEVKSHCQSVHQYDLDALLRANDIEPAQVVGKNVYKPGKFQACKAIGWYVAEYGRAQISINLTNFKKTPPHLVLEEARRLAAERGLVITGSEVVGLIPYEAILEAGKYYLRKQGKPEGIPLDDILKAAMFSMGLHDVSPFDFRKKILGLPATSSNALVQMRVQDFTDEVSRDTPAPGGGSIAALAGALGAALTSMVATLTHGKEGTEARDARLAEMASQAQEVKAALLRAVDEDTNAFNAYMDARRLPQVTSDEKAMRLHKMQEGLKLAVDVPWRTAELSFRAMQLAREAVEIGNPNSITDAAVGAQMGFAGVRGGTWNVIINLASITDAPYVGTMRERCQGVLGNATELLAETVRFVDAKLAETAEKKKK